jgi:hypothetical protein
MPNRRELTPERLAQLRDKLDEVMGEAARLRREINRQLDDQRRSVQQKVTPMTRRRTPRRR